MERGERVTKRTKALQYTKDVYNKVLQRDGCACIFCQQLYRMPTNYSFEKSICDMMHFVNRSQGGLGIEENLAVGCRYHHSLLDNGNLGIRDEMIQLFETYLKSRYPEWNKENLYYKKENFK